VFRFVETFHHFFAFCLSVFWILLVKHQQIIDKETFKLANEKRVRKATASIGQTEEVKLLKQITFCKECGQKLTRTKDELWDCRRPECYRFNPV
jgi:hypothetical protein